MFTWLTLMIENAFIKGFENAMRRLATAGSEETPASLEWLKPKAALPAPAVESDGTPEANGRRRTVKA